MKHTILTGLRANNDLHIGNYFGAMMPIIDMARQHADEYTINMFVPDLHSFTTPIDHETLQRQTIDNARKYIAAGLPLDHANVHLYRQSYIPAHSELTWILNCFAGMGEMRRMTQYKDKSTSLGDERTTVGLFDYPVLMAADILLYSADYVPVGDDQTQHLEFTRDIGERMNRRFAAAEHELFTIPRPVKEQHEFFGSDQGLRIRDLTNPAKKMSKSDDSAKGLIFLGDDPKLAAKKIMAAATDSEQRICYDWDGQPGVTNLLQLLALVTQRDQAHINAQWEGQTSYGDLKQAVAHSVAEFLTNYQKMYHLIDEAAVAQLLETSEQEMNVIANQTLLRVQQAVGLRPRG